MPGAMKRYRSRAIQPLSGSWPASFEAPWTRLVPFQKVTSAGMMMIPPGNSASNELVGFWPRS